MCVCLVFCVCMWAERVGVLGALACACVRYAMT